MKNKSVIGRVVKTVSHSKFLIALSLVFSVASVVLSLYIPVLAGRAIDGIASAGSVDFGIVIRALVTLAVCALVSGVLQWVMTSVNNRIAYNAVRELRDAAFGRIQHLPVSYVDSHPYGDIVSRITADAEAFSDGLVLGFSQLFTGVVTVAVTLGFMLSISPSIALAVVVLTPLSLFTARFIANRTYDMFKKQSETRGEQTSLMNEMIQNQKTVQAFSYGERALGRFDGVNEKLRKYSLRATFFSSLTNPTTRFINNLIYAVVGLAGVCKLSRIFESVHKAVQRDFRSCRGASERLCLRRENIRADRRGSGKLGRRKARSRESAGQRRVQKRRFLIR